MNSPLRAAPDLKAEVAEKVPLLLAHEGGALVPARAGLVALDRPTGRGSLEDIVAARMRELAARIAGSDASPGTANLDDPLDEADQEIEPISLATISGLRAAPSAFVDEGGARIERPAPIRTEIDEATVVPTEPVSAISAIVAAPVDPYVVHSERDLQSLLAVLEPPIPLRLADDQAVMPLVPAETDAEVTEVDTPADETTPSEPPAQKVGASGGTPLSRRIEQASSANQLMSAATEPSDPTVDNLRLVDLIRRQKSLLEQLNRFPPVSAPLPPIEDASAVEPPPRSVFDRLPPAPHPPATVGDPPPLPPSRTLQIAAEPPEVAVETLPQRSPIIIQRARAERSGSYDPGAAPPRPSALPAFAAGVAVAIAIAGALLFVL